MTEPRRTDGAAPAVEVRLLGTPEVRSGDAVVEVRAGRGAGLLCLLALAAGRAVATERLLDQLWGDEAPRSGAAALHVVVSRLRAQLAPVGVQLTTTATGYALEVDAASVDALRLPADAAEAERMLAAGDAASALGTARGALALWRGEPFEGAIATSDLEAARERLEGARRRAHAVVIRAFLALRDPASAMREADDLTTLAPLDEEAWVLRLEAEHATGRVVQALRLFEQYRVRLAEELGVDPGPRLREVHARLLRATAEEPPTMSASRPLPRDEMDAPEPPVGRVVARGALERVVAETASGRGGVVVLEGAPGIGKSYLADYAAALAERRGIRVVRGRAHDGAGAPPLWIWQRVLGALPGAADPSGAADLAALRASTPAGDAEQELFRLTEAVVERIVRAAADPLLLVLDDVHWADDASLAVLRLLATTVDAHPVAVVVTSRHPVRTTSVTSTLAVAGSGPRSSRHVLPSFDELDVRELVQRERGTEPTEAEIRALLHRTGGNPFFLMSLIVAGASGAEMPSSVADMVLARLAALPAASREAVELAAIGGLDLDIPVLAQALGVGAVELLELLQPAADLGLLGDSDGAWAFVHSLAADAVLRALPASARVRGHARYADAVEALSGSGDDTRLEQLAFHLVQAAGGGYDERASGACERAADRAHAALAADRAAQFRAHALTTLPPNAEGGARRRAELLLRLGEELREAGDVRTAAARMREAVRAALDLGDRELLIRSLSPFGGITLWNWRQFGELDRETVDVLERLLADADEPLTDRERVELGGALAMELYYGDEVDTTRCLEVTAECLALAERIGDPALLSRAYSTRVFSLWRRHRHAERLEVLDAWLALPSPSGEIVARLHRAAIRLSLADVDGFLEDSERAAQLIPQLGRLEFAAQQRGQHAAHLLLCGRLDEAAEAIDETFELLGRTSMWGGDWTRAMQRLAHARVAGTQGGLVDELLVLASQDAHRTLRWAAVLCLAQAGRVDEARAMQARWGLRRMPTGSSWNSDFEDALAAEVALHLGTPDPAEAYAVVAGSTAPVVVVGTALAAWMPRDLLLARLASALGRDELAAEHSARARQTDAVLTSGLGVPVAWGAVRGS